MVDYRGLNVVTANLLALSLVARYVPLLWLVFKITEKKSVAQFG
jgi:hypothetical protein